ncbi:MAG TPA: spermine synthase [Anaerolineae bacterium]|nr:spermine synthase [Anaerolineae bacterium]
MRLTYLDLLVFVAGLTTLGTELSASRLLAPAFGNSLPVWAALIGLILLYLSVGGWLGGRLADRWPRRDVLYRVTAWAAVALALVPLLSRPVLHLAVSGVESFNVGLLAGSLLAVLLLFALPVTLLGGVSPWAIRLLTTDSAHSGRVAGRVTAVATVGSLVGTFLPVFWLIPAFGTRRAIHSLSLFLLGVSVVGLWQEQRLRAVGYGLLWLLLASLAWRTSVGPIKPESGLRYETESAYNYIQVLERGGEFWLRLNEGAGLHSVYRPGAWLAEGIWDYFLIVPYFNPPPYDETDVHSLLLIGLAGGTVSKLYTRAYGPIPIDGVEIDPTIIAVGRRFFAMTEPNLNAVVADGRWFLSHTQQRYDVIAVDAYRPPYIPFYLTTREFFALARNRLTDRGVVAVNVARTHTDFRLVNAIASTMQAVFPSVYIIDEPDQGADIANSLVVGTVQPTQLENWYANTARLQQPMLVEMARRAGPHIRLAPPASIILTDDHAPIEQIVHALILAYLMQ